MDRVCVLMSTYNGEKYLREQLDSIVHQSGVEVHIIVRDDGSSDATIQILSEYKVIYGIEYYQGENVGPARSFIELIDKSPNFDYYAFADQDDVWDNDKLLIGVTAIKAFSACPALYYSNLRLVDSQLKFYRNAHLEELFDKNKFSCLLINYGTGCTEVFNRKLVDLVRGKCAGDIIMHDWWLYIISKFFGKVVYDFTPHISYRQHENNVVGMPLHGGVVEYFKKKVKRILNRKFQPRYCVAKSFYNAYSAYLTKEEANEISKLINYKKNAKTQFEVIFNKKFKTKSFIRNMFFIGMILMKIA